MAMTSDGISTCGKIKEAILMIMDFDVYLWTSTEERPISKFVNHAGCYKNYGSYIVDALIENDLIEYVGSRRGKQQKYRILTKDFNADKIASDIYERYIDTCKKYNKRRRDKYKAEGKKIKKSNTLKLGDLKFFY